MLIQSKFKDYYDYVQKDGVDRTLVYVRKTEEVFDSRGLRSIGTIPTLPWQERLTGERWSTKLCYWDYCKIQFCGKVYIGAHLDGAFSFDPEKVKIIEKAATNWRGETTLYRLFDEDVPIAAIYPGNARELHLVDRIDVVYDVLHFRNCPLRHLNFQQVMPPEQAFQELAMWHANRKEAPPIPAVPDRILAEAKGFNKHSFRKEKK